MSQLILSGGQDDMDIMDGDKISVDKAVRVFEEKIASGYILVVQGCRIYALLVDQSLEDAAAFRTRLPKIPAIAWKDYERIGRGRMHPEMLSYRSCPGVQRLSKLPYEIQEKYSNDRKFNLLLAGGDTMLISIKDMSKEQSRQAFSDDDERDLPKQKAYLEDLKMKSLREVEIEKSNYRIYEKPWRIINKKIIEISGVRFERKDLVSMLSEMES